MSVRTFFSMAIAVGLLLTTGAAQAATVYFDNNTADGKYETTGNWSDGSTRYLPAAGDNGLIASGLTATLSSNVSAYVPSNLYVGYVRAAYPTVFGDGTLMVNNAAANLRVGSFSLGYSDSTTTQSTGTIQLSAGSISTGGTSYIGRGDSGVTGPAGSAGVFTQTGGTCSIGGDLYMGNAVNTSGSLTITGNGSQFNVAGTSLYIGYSENASGTLTLGTSGGADTCAFTANGATVMVGAGYGGSGAGSTGTLTVQGASTFSARLLRLGGDSSSATDAVAQVYIKDDAVLTVASGAYIGRYGTAIVDQTGGGATFGYTVYIASTNGNGTYNISGGTLNAAGSSTKSFSIGAGGNSNGAINVSGDAEVNIDTKLLIGYNGIGTYEQTGGTTTANNTVALGRNPAGSGTLTVSGGTFDCTASSLYVGWGGTGAFNLQGGDVTVNGSTIVGYGSSGPNIMTQTGGTLSTTGNVSLGTYGGTGTYDISDGVADIGGYLHLGYQANGLGTLIQSGGTITTVNDCFVGVSGSGSYTMSGGTATFGGGLRIGHSANTGTFTQTGGTINARGLTVSNGCTATVSGGTLNGTGTFTIGKTADTSYLYIQDTAVVSLPTAHSNIAYSAGDNGVINQTGGTASFAKMQVGLAGNGTYEISGGSLYFGGIPWGGLYVGYYDGALGTFNQTGGDVTCDAVSLGSDGGDGEMTISAGTMTSTGEFSIAGSSAGTGVVTVTGGTLEAETSLHVGHRGIGTLNYTGGTITVADRTYVGNDTGATGSIDFGTGNRTLTTRSLFAASSQVAGTGSIDTNGLVSDVNLVLDSTGSLTQTLNWGSVAVNLDLATPANNGALGAGWNGTGTLEIKGGVSVTSEDGYLGYRAGSTGTATVSENATWNVGYLVIGREGAGTLNLVSGTINLFGGEIETRSGGTGVFNFPGGTLKDMGDLNTTVNLQSGGSGAVFQQAAYAGTVSGNISGDGTLTKTGAETLTLSGTNSYTGLTTVQDGTLQLTGPAAWDPVLSLGGADLQAGKMVFDYSGESTPAATIESLLTASYNSGAWDTGKFLSTTSDGTHGLGWLDDLSSEVTVMYTLYGDAELNGTVDFDDLNIVLSNYNQTGVWADGNFDYDDDVDFDDLNLVLSNYNQSLGMLNVGSFELDAQAISALSAAGFTVVPEPSTLALLACGLIGLLAYVWKKRR